jgi:hypothetical protein
VVAVFSRAEQRAAQISKAAALEVGHGIISQQGDGQRLSRQELVEDKTLFHLKDFLARRPQNVCKGFNTNSAAALDLVLVGLVERIAVEEA